MGLPTPHTVQPQDMTAEAPMYDYGYGGYVDGGRLADLDDMVNIDEQDGDDYVFGLGDHENNSDDDDDELNRGGRNGPSPKCQWLMDGVQSIKPDLAFLACDTPALPLI